MSSQFGIAGEQIRDTFFSSEMRDELAQALGQHHRYVQALLDEVEEFCAIRIGEATVGGLAKDLTTLKKRAHGLRKFLKKFPDYHRTAFEAFVLLELCNHGGVDLTRDVLGDLFDILEIVIGAADHGIAKTPKRAPGERAIDEDLRRHIKGLGEIYKKHSGEEPKVYPDKAGFYLFLQTLFHLPELNVEFVQAALSTDRVCQDP